MPYWTTADRRTEEQFSYWREVICEAFAPLSPEQSPTHRAAGPEDRGFGSWVLSSPLTATNCAEVSSKTQRIRHGAAEVRRTSSEQVFVNLQVKGHCVGKQDGRECFVAPGGLALFDTTSQYELEYVADPAAGEWRVLSFRVPRGELLPLLAQAHGFTAIAHDAADSGIAGLVADTMTSIWRNRDGLDGFTATTADSTFVSTLAAGIGGGERLRESRREALDASLRAGINRYVAAHLRTADLSPSNVAHRFAISVRKLHSLYEGTGSSYAKTVMRRRLEACSRDLVGGDQTITDIASTWGFYDLSHLNRVFRAHYGCLPSDIRQAALAQAS